MVLSDMQKWQIVAEKTINYDGIFYLAVKTTGIYCKPSCRARTPLKKNVLFYDTKTAAEKAGFRPCKLCRPDLIDYRPFEEMAQAVKEHIDRLYYDRDQLMSTLNEMGLTYSHLSTVFSKQFGQTPFEYRNNLRLEKAQSLLLKTDRQIIEIAFSCGFDSVAAFYRCFKKEFGLPPKEYRLRYRKE